MTFWTHYRNVDNNTNAKINIYQKINSVTIRAEQCHNNNDVAETICHT